MLAASKELVFDFLEVFMIEILPGLTLLCQSWISVLPEEFFGEHAFVDHGRYW
jgi:hypothetical protein